MAENFDALNSFMSALGAPEATAFQGQASLPTSPFGGGAAGLGGRLFGQEGALAGMLLGPMVDPTGKLFERVGDSPWQSYYDRKFSAAHSAAKSAFFQQQNAPMANMLQSATGMSANAAGQALMVGSMFAPGLMTTFAKAANANYFDQASQDAISNAAGMAAIRSATTDVGRFETDFYRSVGTSASGMLSRGISSGAAAYGIMMASRKVGDVFGPGAVGSRQFSSQMQGVIDSFSAPIQSIMESAGVDSATAVSLSNLVGGSSGGSRGLIAASQLSDMAHYGKYAGLSVNELAESGAISASRFGLSRNMGGIIGQMMAKSAAMSGGLTDEQRSERQGALGALASGTSQSMEGRAMAYVMAKGTDAEKKAAINGSMDMREYGNRHYRQIMLDDTGANSKHMTEQSLSAAALQHIRNTGTRSNKAAADYIMHLTNRDELDKIASDGSDKLDLKYSGQRQLATLRLSEIASKDERIKASIAQQSTGDKETAQSPESLAKSIKTIADSATSVMDGLTKAINALVSKLGNDEKGVFRQAEAVAHSAVRKR